MAEALDADRVLAQIQEQGVAMVDFKFIDMPGAWQHLTIPARQVDKGKFVRGIGFDGSSIRGFQGIEESDMLLMPDPATARMDPFAEAPTLSILCNVNDPVTRAPYSRDPRQVAQRAEAYLKRSGIADTSYWGPELEFYLLGSVQYEVSPHRMGYAIDSPEASWNTQQPGLGYHMRPKGGYFPVPPGDTLHDARSEMALELEKWGIPVEMHHHEVGHAGQVEIEPTFSSLTATADYVMACKYMAKNVARRRGMTATFMPKPLFGDNGSGMHVNQSLWQGETNIFYRAGGYADLSDVALWYIGGLLTHVDALMALCACSTNSYRRLVPHYEAPVNVVFGARNRSAAVRIPSYIAGPESARSKRVEFRVPDATCNPYLAMAAILMAGLDGVERRLDPSKAGFGPVEGNTYDMTPAEAASIRGVPTSLEAALAALEADHEFLLKGGVFTPDLIQTWVRYKRTHEIEQVAIRPVPYEFFLYFDI